MPLVATTTRVRISSPNHTLRLTWTLMRRVLTSDVLVVQTVRPLLHSCIPHSPRSCSPRFWRHGYSTHTHERNRNNHEHLPFNVYLLALACYCWCFSLCSLWRIRNWTCLRTWRLTGSTGSRTPRSCSPSRSTHSPLPQLLDGRLVGSPPFHISLRAPSVMWLARTGSLVSVSGCHSLEVLRNRRGGLYPTTYQHPPKEQSKFLLL